MSDGCYFCGGGSGVIEQHHIVPRRFNGTDEGENLVNLCPTCHEKLERLYDKRFYDAIGAEKPDSDTGEINEVCGQTGCSATADHELTCPQGGAKSYYCTAHKVCANTKCDKKRVTPVPINGTLIPFCEEHRTCESSDCESKETQVYRADSAGRPGEVRDHRVYCEHHAVIESPWMGDEWLEVWSDE